MSESEDEATISLKNISSVELGGYGGVELVQPGAVVDVKAAKDGAKLIPQEPYWRKRIAENAVEVTEKSAEQAAVDALAKLGLRLNSEGVPEPIPKPAESKPDPVPEQKKITPDQTKPKTGAPEAPAPNTDKGAK